MGLEQAFAACLPKKPPAFALDSKNGLPAKPVAIPAPPAPSSPKPRRPSKDKLAVGLPSTPSRSVPLTVKIGLALAALALVWRRLFVIYSRTTNAIFVFVAIEMLVWLRFRSGSRASVRAVGAKPAKRERGLSTALAQEGEARVIQLIRERLRADAGLTGVVTDNDELLEVQLLRFVREHGLHDGKVEKRFRAMLEWKQKTFTDEALREQVNPEEDLGYWLSSEEMPKGKWATELQPKQWNQSEQRPLVSIGLNIGLSKSGNPVKIERIGRYAIDAIKKQPTGNEDLKVFYLHLVEHICHRLDHMTIQEGRLQQTYEIFDLEGLSWQLVSMSTLKFTQDVLLAFSTHYPSSFRKAVIINAPSFIGHVWGACSKVLPDSVNAKVNILGPDYMETLRADLSEEALQWVSRSDYDLCRAPRDDRAATANATTTL